MKRKIRPVDPSWAVGIAFHVLDGPAERPETVAAYVEAFLADVWTKPLRQLISQSVAGRTHPRRAGLVPTAERAALLRELLVHPDLWEVALSHRDKNTGHHESFDVGTRKQHEPYVRVYGHQTFGDDHARADGWVRVMLTLAEKVGVHHGVVPVMNPWAVRSEGALVGATLNGVDTHPFPQEFARIRAVERELGTKYVRFPRWGTLYSRVHVEALGGVGKIVDAVKPALVRELPAALYVQLTDSVVTATSAEAAEKQRAFTELVAPLLPPPFSA
ncbi:MAG: hypothetical protein HS111_11930 [Kofleriaceae bacterium]|nr:hypothetical protein [Kofleriaceae bacterium]MCL4227275.1 hypothetical protein [Myxococcales bacterium]